MNWPLPRHAAAVLDALRLTGTPDRMPALSDAEWDSALSFCDRTRLTLCLGQRCGPLLPPRVRCRIESDYARNTERARRLRQAYREMARALRQECVEFLVLKGFTQYPHFVTDANARAQYDLDLFCPREALDAACAALRRLGYEPVGEPDRNPTDHLPPLARKTGWQWRGDYFDPDIPIVVELHFQLWDSATEGFDAAGWTDFWDRRTMRSLGEDSVPVLATADALGYSALHLLRHLLRGSAQPSHVYELACFLHRHTRNTAFWREWRSLHPARLRRLEAIAFRLAAEWFGCALSSVAEEEIAALPRAVDAWFRRYAASPVEQLFRPNKDELWLHLSLVESRQAAARVLRRRLLPPHLPEHVDALYVPEGGLSVRLRVRKWYRYAIFLCSRLSFHSRAHWRTAARGLLWLGAIAAAADRDRQHPEVERKHAPVGEQVAR